LQAGRQADISIIDGKTRRELVSAQQAGDFMKAKKSEAQNPAGTITQEAVKTLHSSIDTYIETKESQLLVVSGEEDLLAIPAILLTPLKSVVVYGQFDQGIVVVEVTEYNKKHVQDLFGKFQ